MLQEIPHSEPAGLGRSLGTGECSALEVTPVRLQRAQQCPGQSWHTGLCHHPEPAGLPEGLWSPRKGRLASGRGHKLPGDVHTWLQAIKGCAVTAGLTLGSLGSGNQTIQKFFGFFFPSLSPINPCLSVSSDGTSIPCLETPLWPRFPTPTG